MAGEEPAVRRKELDELTANARKLLAAAIRTLLAKVESGAATAADLSACARLLDLIGLDRVITIGDEGYSRDVERTLEELDAEDQSGGDWENIAKLPTALR